MTADTHIISLIPVGGPSCLEAVRPIRTLPSSAPAKQQGEDGLEPEVSRSRSDEDLSLR